MNNYGRQVQIFLVGDHMAEVNGVLMAEEREQGWYHVSYKEDSFSSEVYHMSLPTEQIRSIRYYDLETEEAMES
jgi:hypothetical protein